MRCLLSCDFSLRLLDCGSTTRSAKLPTPDTRRDKGLAKFVIDDRAFPPWQALGDLHQAQLHPRTNLIEPHSALLALTVIPADIVLRERDDVRLVFRSRRYVRRRRALVPICRARALTTPRPQHIIRDVLLVAQVEHCSTTTTGTS